MDEALFVAVTGAEESVDGIDGAEDVVDEEDVAAGAGEDAAVESDCVLAPR